VTFAVDPAGIFASAVSAQIILPKTFAGWSEAGDPKTSPQPEQIDVANAAALREYGYEKSETATYTRADGRKLTIRATQFKDATGAYGAFTFYRDPEMKSERIGTKAASANQRIVFFRNNIVVDATFDRVNRDVGGSCATWQPCCRPRAPLPICQGFRNISSSMHKKTRRVRLGTDVRLRQ
jgi:hypothetical protein